MFLESFVDFLEFSHGQQMACDAAVDAALLPSTAQGSPTELRYRKSSLGESTSSALPSWCAASRDALRSASNAVEAVAQIASLHIVAAPCDIPSDCLTLSPATVFLTLYNHALECVLQATRIAVDPCSSLHATTATGCAITRDAASAAMQTLLVVAEGNCTALNALVGVRAGCTPSYATRTPDLLRAWMRIAFWGDFSGAQAIVEPLVDDALIGRCDAVTLADALCLCSLALQLQGFPERALPLLSRALAASESMKDCSQGWKCARGERSYTMALLLRAEAKRNINAADGSYADWLDDVRMAARCSRDESRQFAGIPISGQVDLQVFSLPPTTPSRGGGDVAQGYYQTLRVLPRLLHRLGHMYCGSVFLALSNECHSQADVVSQRCEPSEVAAASVVEQPSLLFWYDVVAICGGVTSLRNGATHGSLPITPGHHFKCLRHLPLCTGGSCRHDDEVPHEASIACFERPIDVSAPIRGTSIAEPIFQTLFMEFIAQRCRGSKSGDASTPKNGIHRSLKDVRPFAQQPERRPVEVEKEGDSISQPDAPPRTAPFNRAASFAERQANREPLRGRTGLAFNSSYVLPKQAPPPVSAKPLDNTAPLNLKRTSSTRNVFDRLTTPSSARGVGSRSDSVDQRRPLSARFNSSGNMSARPASAGLRRSNSAASLYTSPDDDRSESRLANSIRGKVNGMR